ncbi:exported hypothetical protein [Vibrio crassostreae]|nr:hypothetical protein [Vibrio crassostreae]CAK1838916.1 exported hypothetical protein [Vibrio crassostreae]CAK1847122.1 exported hypothetical protein [Vibrio crassostreae]CAK1848164.1 exported hypothetical protein [Vibrio crassostreae]CAK1850685.1 exported hypothetical protein [Vibrio crassostreae]CAK1860983.1 exported hypothetical protein [Vibrio crassostreae]
MKNRILALSLLGLSSSVFADSELPSSSYEMTVALCSVTTCMRRRSI